MFFLSYKHHLLSPFYLQKQSHLLGSEGDGCPGRRGQQRSLGREDEAAGQGGPQGLCSRQAPPRILPMN